jgi:hypothetical protein
MWENINQSCFSTSNSQKSFEQLAQTATAYSLIVQSKVLNNKAK